MTVDTSLQEMAARYSDIARTQAPGGTMAEAKAPVQEDADTALVAAASIPTLASLFQRGKDKGLLTEQVAYK